MGYAVGIGKRVKGVDFVRTNGRVGWGLFLLLLRGAWLCWVEFARARVHGCVCKRRRSWQRAAANAACRTRAWNNNSGSRTMHQWPGCVTSEGAKNHETRAVQ